MGFGAPWNFADATFSVKVSGDGQNVNYVYRPVSPQSFVAWSPPGALTTQSLMSRQRVKVFSGSNTLVNGATIAAFAPWSASYVVVVPPANSAVTKTLKGNVSDVGVALIPNLPLVLALPSPLPASWQLVMAMGSAEDLDVLIF